MRLLELIAIYTDCMLHRLLNIRTIHLLLPVAGIICLVVPPPAAHAWENDGHRMVNRLAASTLPDTVPAFLRTQAAIAEIEYLGPEPDRWRAKAESELKRRPGAGALHRL